MEVMLLRDEKIASFKKRRKPGYPKHVPCPSIGPKRCFVQKMKKMVLKKRNSMKVWRVFVFCTSKDPLKFSFIGRDWSPKFKTGLNIIIGIVQKV